MRDSHNRITTITDLSMARPGWAEDLASTGIRAVVCPMMRQGVWFTKNGHTVDYAWDEKAGGPMVPHNATTGVRYRGMNTIMLGMSPLRPTLAGRCARAPGKRQRSSTS